MRDAQLDELVALCADGDRDVRIAAPLGLVYVGDRAVSHLEKLLARDGETGHDLKAAGGLGRCLQSVCGALKDIATRRAIRALDKAAKAGAYGRLPGDMLYLGPPGVRRGGIAREDRRARGEAPPRSKPRRSPAADRPAAKPKR